MVMNGQVFARLSVVHVSLHALEDQQTVLSLAISTKCTTRKQYKNAHDLKELEHANLQNLRRQNLGHNLLKRPVELSILVQTKSDNSAHQVQKKWGKNQSKEKIKKGTARDPNLSIKHFEQYGCQQQKERDQFKNPQKKLICPGPCKYIICEQSPSPAAGQWLKKKTTILSIQNQIKYAFKFFKQKCRNEFHNKKIPTMLTRTTQLSGSKTLNKAFYH